MFGIFMVVGDLGFISVQTQLQSQLGFVLLHHGQEEFSYDVNILQNYVPQKNTTARLLETRLAP